MITDAMLAQAAAELAAAINESLPDPEDCTHQFSAGFERKMKRITRKANHPILYRTLQSAASIILVIAIGFGSVLAVSAEARAAVFGWVKEQYESFYEYFFEGEVHNTEASKYSLGWVPEKFTFENSYEIANGEAYIYFGQDDTMIQFSYSNSMESTSLFVEGVDCEKKVVSIGKFSGDLYISTDAEKANGIVWCNDENVLFFISAPLDEDNLIKMAENIVKK